MADVRVITEVPSTKVKGASTHTHHTLQTKQEKDGEGDMAGVSTVTVGAGESEGGENAEPPQKLNLVVQIGAEAALERRWSAAVSTFQLFPVLWNPQKNWIWLYRFV